MEAADPAAPDSNPFGVILSVVVFLVLAGFIFWRWSRRSIDEPNVLALKIGVSVALVLGCVYTITQFHPLVGVPLAACGGLIVGILWGKNIGTAVARPLTGAIDGGDEEPEARPFYAIARAHRKMGRYQEAIAVILEQLAAFPADVEGHLLLAEIRAMNLNDWDGAAATIEHVVQNPEIPVVSRAKALQALADWHLDRRRDGPAARAVLGRIIEMFPGTPSATEAAQRQAHVVEEQDGWRQNRSQEVRLKVPKGDPSLGLRQRAGDEPSPAEIAEQERASAAADLELCLAQLRQHPHDTEARERLASDYAKMGHYDLAIGEMEWLIGLGIHPPKLVAKWLHQMADFHVKKPESDVAAARATLERVLTLYPNTALSAVAKSRMDYLGLESRGQRGTNVLRAGDGDQRPA